MKYITFIVLFFACIQAKAQDVVHGQLLDSEGEALIGATVNWAEKKEIGGVTNALGWFEVKRLGRDKAYYLEIRYVGYETTTVEILPSEDSVIITVEGISEIEGVVVEQREAHTKLSTQNILNLETINSKELHRGACCSLAESFETNNSVDVSYSDAVTGAREIQMLGLRGTYVQMLVENRPTFNELGSNYGLEFIPGTWVDQINVSKGISTVRNGPQALTGQINTELLKPFSASPFFVNLYANHFGRAELNLHWTSALSQRWSSMFFVHTNYYQNDVDQNEDGFIDVSKKKQINLLGRWFYRGDDWAGQFNVQGLIDERDGGQFAADIVNPFRSAIETQRVSLWGKMAYIGFDNKDQSLAFIGSATLHEQDALFGQRSFLANQRSLYGQAIFQTVLGDGHQLSTGLSHQTDVIDESFEAIELDRTEHLSGLYAEYQHEFALSEDEERRLGWIVGLRGDHHNLHGTYLTPRANLKFNWDVTTVLRLSAGRGMRTPNVLQENMRYMASSRQFKLLENIRPEIAQTYGFNMTKKYYTANQEGALSLDIYHTRFENQLVSDFDSEVGNLLLYNLQGTSRANNMLLLWTQQFLDNFELRLGYKYSDVKVTFQDEFLQKPMVAPHRGLLNIAYETDRWLFNVNAQWVGTQRLMAVQGDVSDLPEYRQTQEAPSFALLNVQVNHYFPSGLELYGGVENALSYTQEAPIINAESPFNNSGRGPAFDAASVYAPIAGARVYVGMRYSLGENIKEEPTETFSTASTASHDHAEEDAFSHHAPETIKTSAQCSMCKEIIETGLGKMDEIIEANLDFKSQILSVRYHSEHISLQQIREKVAALGYHADDVPRDPKAFEQLPACCKGGVHDK